MVDIKSKSTKIQLNSSFKLPSLKRAFLLLPFFFFSAVGSSYGVDAKVQWQQSGETDLAGYKLYYDTDPGAPYDPDPADYADEYSVDGGNTWLPVSGAPPIEVGNTVTEIMLRGLTDTEIYYFALTAYRNGFPDSDYSAERSTFEITLPSPGFYANSSNYDTYPIEGIAITKPNDIIVRAGATSIGGQFSTNANGEWSGSCDFSLISQGPVSLTCQSVADDFTSLEVDGTYDTNAPDSEAASPRQDNLLILVDWQAQDATPGSGLKKTVLWYKWGSNGSWSPNLTAATVTSGTFEFYPGEDNGTYYFATRSVDRAGNWEQLPSGDGDTSIYYTAPSGSPGSCPDGYTGAEASGGGCFIATASSD